MPLLRQWSQGSAAFAKAKGKGKALALMAKGKDKGKGKSAYKGSKGKTDEEKTTAKIDKPEPKKEPKPPKKDIEEPKPKNPKPKKDAKPDEDEPVAAKAKAEKPKRKVNPTEEDAEIAEQEKVQKKKKNAPLEGANPDTPPDEPRPKRQKAENKTKTALEDGANPSSSRGRQKEQGVTEEAKEADEAEEEAWDEWDYDWGGQWPFEERQKIAEMETPEYKAQAEAFFGDEDSQVTEEKKDSLRAQKMQSFRENKEFVGKAVKKKMMGTVEAGKLQRLRTKTSTLESSSPNSDSYVTPEARKKAIRSPSDGVTPCSLPD